MNKQELKSKIEKLEKGLASKVTPENLKASLKSQKAKFEKELADLEKKENKDKSVVSDKIKALKDKVKSKVSSITRDGARKAKKAGKRIAEDGSVYYEKRANRTDRQTKKKPYLEKGGELEGMTANIYRSDYDSPTNKLYGKKNVTIVDSEVPKIFEANENAPAVRLVRRNIGWGMNEYNYIHAVPVGIDDHRAMMGGTFIYSSDSRFPNKFPIPLHDRVEGYEKGGDLDTNSKEWNRRMIKNHKETAAHYEKMLENAEKVGQSDWDIEQIKKMIAFHKTMANEYKNGKMEKGGSLSNEEYDKLTREYDKLAALAEDSLGEEKEEYKRELEKVAQKIHKEERGYAAGGELNLGIRKMAQQEGFTPKELGKEYQLVMGQAVVEALTDANFHSEARKLISILEKKPEWAASPNNENMPRLGTTEYDEWRKSSVYSSEYYDADEKTRDFAIKVSQKSGWDGYAIAGAFEYLVKVDGGYHKLADNIEKAMESEDEMAKGGSIAKKYTVNVYYGGEMKDEEFYTDSLDEAKQLSQQGEHSEIYDNMKKQFVDMEYAKGGNTEIYEVELSAESNPDFEKSSHEGSVNIKSHKVKAKSIENARDVVMSFIMENDLGGGNWSGGNVYKNGEKIGHVSYNGRYWDDTKMAKGGYMAQGGDLNGNLYKVHFLKVFENGKEGDTIYVKEVYANTEKEALSNFKKMHPKYKIEYLSKYKDGGYMAKGGETNYTKKWRAVYITLQGRSGTKEITLGRLSDKYDVMNALKRMPDLNIREVTMIKELKEKGGEIEEDVYNAYVIWIDNNDEAFFDGGWNSIEDAEDRVSDIYYEEEENPKYSVFAVEYDEDYFENKNWDITRLKSYRPYGSNGRHKMENGGSIPNNYEGMHPREVWNAWSLEQKRHFLVDHNTHPYSQVGLKKKDREEIAEDFSYDDLPKNIQLVISDHIEDGQYANGGSVSQNISVFGYETLNFDICPIAREEFQKAMTALEGSSDATKVALSRAAMYVDDVFGTEKEAKAKDYVSKAEFEYAVNQSLIAASYNYAAGFEVNLLKFMPMHISEIASKLVYVTKNEDKDDLTAYDLLVAKDKIGEAAFKNMTVDERRNLAREHKESYADGGSIEEGNYRMVVSQAKAIKHHADELLNVLTPDMEVEAWVVSKMQRASTDLSDITHYIDGFTPNAIDEEVDYSFEKGGQLEKGVYYLGKPKKEGSVWAQKIVELDKDGLSFATDYARKLKDFPSKDYKKISDEELTEFIKNSPKHRNVSSDPAKWDSYASGGMIAGRWYKDNQGKEHRFIGEDSEGRALFSDGERVSAKSLEDFESDTKETKLFKWFKEGGAIDDRNERKNKTYYMVIWDKNNVVDSEYFDNEDDATIKFNEVVKDKAILVNLDRIHFNEYGWQDEMFTLKFHSDKMEKGGLTRGGLTKEETLKVAEKFAKAIAKSDNAKVTVNTKTLEEDSFDLDMNGEEFDGGSYSIYSNGDVKNMALSGSPVYGKTTSSVEEIVENLSKKASGGFTSSLSGTPDRRRLTMAEGGYVAVSEKDGYWYIMSKPTTKESAEQLISLGVPRGEEGKVVTLKEAKEHKKVIGKEYLADGGKVKEIDMDEVESSAKFYTDDSKWTTKPTIKKFQDEIDEYETLKNKLDKKEITPSKVIGTGYKSQLARPLAYRWLNERTLIAKRAIEILKERGSKMAMGGKVKFEDKVKSIKASLLKTKKVPKKVQKDYGKTYSPKEAEQAAKRIAGSMRKKGMK